MMFTVPQTFNDWRRCIVHDCKINLTKEFAQQRLSVYENKEHTETVKFVSLYGEQHLKNVIGWLKVVLQ